MIKKKRTLASFNIKKVYCFWLSTSTRNNLKLSSKKQDRLGDSARFFIWGLKWKLCRNLKACLMVDGVPFFKCLFKYHLHGCKRKSWVNTVAKLQSFLPSNFVFPTCTFCYQLSLFKTFLFVDGLKVKLVPSHRLLWFHLDS